jgi:hypothetical protein
MSAVRGSVWNNTSKKAGFSKSIGSYGYNGKGDRFFKLTTVSNGKTRMYESPAAAERDGWFIVTKGK